MTKSVTALAALLFGCLTLGAAAQSAPARHPPAKAAAPKAAPAPAGPVGDYPTLADRGGYVIGVLRLDVTIPDQPDLTSTAKPAPRYDRVLPLTVWYPATRPSKSLPARFDDHVAGPVASGRQFGTAFAKAAPIKGQAFPLVVFSHGYNNWATGYIDLAESLASNGYVVAVIDHRDELTPTGGKAQNSFGMVQYARSTDQRFVIAELTRRSETGPLAGVYDPSRIALMGYSMGGYGAMITAGAGIDPTSPQLRAADNPLAVFAEGSPLIAQGAPPGLKAVVAMAPWGASSKTWRDSGMAKVRTPTLFIVGDHDDVSGYGPGVKWIYEHETGADRWMLVYQNAHHNIAGDGEISLPGRDFSTIERFEEPVWRRDRILAINRHFITAFLDSTLKADASHGAYLAVPTVKAEDGVWPQTRGAPASADPRAVPGDPAAKGFWPGFQRRWALGLELHHDTAKP